MVAKVENTTQQQNHWDDGDDMMAIVGPVRAEEVENCCHCWIAVEAY